MSESLHDKMLTAKHKLSEAKEKYLTSQGWKYTCDTPGCLWLWEKKIGDRTFVVPQDTALQIAFHMDRI